MGEFPKCRYYSEDYYVKINKSVFDEKGNVISDAEKKKD